MPAQRTGYTGEDGFEIYLPALLHRTVQEILERGYEEGIRPIGLGARDSLRLEAGLPLYGHEISRSISPIEGGIGWTVKLSKEDNFIGKKALESVKNESSPKRLIHFKCEGKRIARQGCLILADGQKAGEVLSGTFSPMTECAIGSALVELEKVKDANLAADIRGKSIPITVQTTTTQTNLMPKTLQDVNPSLEWPDNEQHTQLLNTRPTMNGYATKAMAKGLSASRIMLKIALVT